MKEVNRILYCSSVCSGKMLEYLFNTSRTKPLFSIQKFHGLLTEGIATNGVEITALSSIPVTRTGHRRIWWNAATEYQHNVKFIYPAFINLPYIRNLCTFLFTFFNVLFWCLKAGRNNSVIICDILNVSVSAAGLAGAKICRVKTCAIVTDIPAIWGKSKKQQRKTLTEKLAISVSSYLINSFDSYLFLTRQMNELVNPDQKPFLVLEGLVDIKMKGVSNLMINKTQERILIYAGGIFEEYGIKNLLEAFIRLESGDIRLHIYGDGGMRNEMPAYENLDQRITYHGVVQNQIIVEKLKQATLLINPRPGKQEFTKYSFPSKNLEYMVSGTPLVTTDLPGMPDEYKNYVYIIKDESADGVYRTLEALLSLPREELHAFGQSSRDFVLGKKNNIVQSGKLIDFLNKI